MAFVIYYKLKHKLELISFSLACTNYKLIVNKNIELNVKLMTISNFFHVSLFLLM